MFTLISLVSCVNTLISFAYFDFFSISFLVGGEFVNDHEN